MLKNELIYEQALTPKMIIGIVLFVNRYNFLVYNKIGTIRKDLYLLPGKRSRDIDTMILPFLSFLFDISF